MIIISLSEICHSRFERFRRSMAFSGHTENQSNSCLHLCSKVEVRLLMLVLYFFSDNGEHFGFCNITVAMVAFMIAWWVHLGFILIMVLLFSSIPLIFWLFDPTIFFFLGIGYPFTPSTRLLVTHWFLDSKWRQTSPIVSTCSLSKTIFFLQKRISFHE